MSNATTQLERVQQFFDVGKYLQALEAGKNLGPVSTWQGIEGRILAGRLAARLGAPRLGYVLHYLAWRDDPADYRAREFYARVKLQRSKLWAAWKFLQNHDVTEAPPNGQAYWWLLYAELLGLYRDFTMAHEWISKAEKIIPDDPWLWIVRSRTLFAEDRYEEALESAMHALALRPNVSAVQLAAHILVRFNRDDEALQLLTEATRVIESGDVQLQLGVLHDELGNHDKARDCYQQAEALYPLMEKHLHTTLTTLRSRAAYHCGDLKEAAYHASAANIPFHAAFLPRMQSGQEQRRVLLPVKFVQQHDVTCVPATLAAISEYWSLPYDHLEIAEEICYDGTPNHSERRWAESNGFHVREFRVTWETAIALLDRKIPFLLSTVTPESGHVQAVVGYDTMRRTLIIRDPSHRELSEFLADALFKQLEATGPRGMVMVPTDQADQITGVLLPEFEQYDQYHELNQALELHDRYRAQKVMDEMLTTAADDRLTWYARGTLARYDSDPIALLHSTNGLLSKYPGELAFTLTKLAILQELGSHDDRLTLIQESGKDGAISGPLLLKYTQELSHDTRQIPHVVHLLHRIMRNNPIDPGCLQQLVQVMWDQGERTDALAMSRFVACLSNRDESAARAYFSTARYLGQTETALKLLKDRFNRFMKQSENPAITLCWALEQLNRSAEALSVLESAIAVRPQDGTLLINAAHFHAQHGDFEKAREFLLRAQHHSPKGYWLREAANLALQKNAPSAALARWHEVVALEPLAVDAHQMVARLLADIESSESALAHLRQVVWKYPRNCGLRKLLLEWIKSEGPEQVENAALELIEFQPNDISAHCDLAQAYLYQGRIPEAISQAECAQSLQPSQPAIHALWGRLNHASGDFDKAKEAFREAIRLAVDYESAIDWLMYCCQDEEERRTELRFVYSELVQQTVFGNGLLVFREYASRSFEPEELLRILQEAHESRPDLWHAWSALIRQLIEMGSHKSALALAQRGVDRFPLLAQLHIDLALAHRKSGNSDAEINELHEALRFEPNNVEAARELGRVYRDRGDLSDSFNLLQQAIIRQPYDALLLRDYAKTLWMLQDAKGAFENLEKALMYNPSDEDSWQMLIEWSRHLDEPNRALELSHQLQPSVGIQLVDELLNSQPQEAVWWREKALFLFQLAKPEACFTCFFKAIEINPKDVDMHLMIARHYAMLGRPDDALRACQPDIFGDDLPTPLRLLKAGIMWQQGNSNAALSEVKQLTKEYPDLSEAWSILTNWLCEEPQSEDYLIAATNLTRLAPDNVEGWGHLGCARESREDKDGAKQAFERAIKLDSGKKHIYAWMRLFDLYQGDHQHKEAHQVLDRIAPYLRYVDLLAAEVRVAACEGNQKDAEERFRELCRRRMARVETELWAVSAMIQSGWQTSVKVLLESEIDQGRAGPAALCAWIDVLAAVPDWDYCDKRLADWSDRGLAWEMAFPHYLNVLSDTGDYRRVKRFINRHRDLLHASWGGWLAVSSALFKLGKCAEVVDWMADWKTREGVSPGMLYPLSFSLMMLARDEEAAVVSRHALELPPDNTTPMHLIWVALVEALTGDVATAGERLRQLAAAKYKYSWRQEVLYRFVVALVGGLGPRTSGDAPASYRISKRQLRQAMASFPAAWQDQWLNRLFYRSMYRLAKACHHPIAAMWWSYKARLK